MLINIKKIALTFQIVFWVLFIISAHSGSQTSTTWCKVWTTFTKVGGNKNVVQYVRSSIP